MKNTWKRGAGILMPISSLPSNYGIGTFGKEAYQFVDDLVEAKQSYWQVLPLGPTSYGDSPYQSFSAFAGNPYFIDLDLLKEEGLLNNNDLEALEEEGDQIRYDWLFDVRYEVLRKAFARADYSQSKEYAEFLKENQWWLEDYALFMACKEYFGQKEWLLWEDDIRVRESKAVSKYKEQLKEDVAFWKFVQFHFFKQWAKLKAYANKNEIKIIGDIPIYVAMDSADVWASPELFQLDENQNPTVVAGCPPDAFSATGQKWGNPLYDWEKLEDDDFNWWRQRMSKSAERYDVIRIDHFIGMVRYYVIPADQDATHGWYNEGPGMKLVDAINESIGDAMVIAEDLGNLTDEVRRVLKATGYPGMKVLEFAFDSGNSNEYLPHFCIENAIQYIGTHDNDTFIGYYNELEEEAKEYLNAYMGENEESKLLWKMIRVMYMGVAHTVIMQMQDLLGKDSGARMNFPSTIGGNWTWRMKKNEFSKEIKERLAEFGELYARK